MTRLIEKKEAEDKKKAELKEASKTKKIDIDKLGNYKSTQFYHEQDEFFQDDDDLVLMQILMDTSDRVESKKAVEKHISKVTNKKSMLCP